MQSTVRNDKFKAWAACGIRARFMRQGKISIETFAQFLLSLPGFFQGRLFTFVKKLRFVRKTNTVLEKVDNKFYETVMFPLRNRDPSDLGHRN